jgi:hypothetical protein
MMDRVSDMGGLVSESEQSVELGEPARGEILFAASGVALAKQFRADVVRAYESHPDLADTVLSGV